MVKGLFVCCLFLEYVSLSRRFVPELLNFLLGILYIATPNKKSQGKLIMETFKYALEVLFFKYLHAYSSKLREH